jgi:hypothetical protein
MLQRHIRSRHRRNRRNGGAGFISRGNRQSLQRRILLMDHVVSVALDAGTLKQLDDLRRADPNVPNRTQIIQRLIWDAHARIAQPEEASAKDPA